MNFGSSFSISASALTAQRLRMDVITSNIANAETTRATVVDGKAVPYRRKLVELESVNSGKFYDTLQSQLNRGEATGVKVRKISEDSSPFKPVYNPTHPDADANGYVYMPNVDVTKEMVDMISVSRSYDANVTMFNAAKAMVSKGLEIGRA